MRSIKNGGFEQNQQIIQCPQCQTKFAVDTTSLAGIDSPRFHCSRCDHVFSLEARNKLPAHSLAEPPPPPASKSAGTSANERATASQNIDFQMPPAAGVMAQTMSEPRPQANQMKFDFSAGSLAREPMIERVPDFPPAVPGPSYRTEVNVPAPSALSAQAPQTSTRWTSFAIIVAPLIFFMSAVVGASYYMRQHSSEADELLSSFSSSAPQLAPPELSIEDAKLKKVPLDSGESAYLISGTLSNAADRAFRDIQLEGLAFDQSGRLVARARVDSSATLAKTRVRSLSPAMIKDLQAGKVKSKQALKPGQSQDFSFALLEGDPSKAKFFTARVYSVGQ